VATTAGAGAIERALPLLTAAAREAAIESPGGYLDLIGPSGEPPSTGLGQDLMLSSVVPRIYERWWRPMLGRMVKGVFGPGWEEEKRIARLLLGLSPRDGVLDVACGTGPFTRDFARAVGPDGLVVGIDVSETMLTRAVADTRAVGLDQVAFVRGDAAELPFKDRSFDAVCCFAALHLFSDPLRALDRMTAVLDNGGRIAIFTSARGRTAPMRTFEALAQARTGMRMFEQDDIVGALEDRGYVEIRQRVTGFTQFVGGRLAD
jgi:ubiquinone/menaquinone biosynthesis C-methylase UbiE